MNQDLAWAAGLFEGEGCFSPRRPNGKQSMHLYAAIASTDEDVVLRFAEIVGVGNVVKLRKRLPHHKDAWRWSVNGDTVERVYDLLSPWLGKRRKARYAELLAERHEYEKVRVRGNRRHDPITGQFTMGRLPR